MQTTFVLGLVLVASALGALSFALLGDASPRVPKGRRRSDQVVVNNDPLLRRAYRRVVSLVDRTLRSRGWVPVRAEELEMADVRKPLSVVVTWLMLASVVAFAVGFLVVGGLLMGLVLAVATPFVFRVWLKMKAGRRRKKFAGQLDTTLRIIASALRAGQSLPIAMASVAGDVEAPMGQELSRVVNENRVGRDLVEALMDSAERMGSEDLRWFAEAVDVQRDTGGNLNDIIDVVAETIRDRAEIREKINAYASEGKASAVVLMGLPVGLGGVYTLMNPGYLDPLFITTIGKILLVVSVILYGVSWVWMRSIVNIKV